MNPLTAALEFVESINNEETPDGVSKRIAELGQSFGFTSFCLAAIPEAGASFDGSIMLSVGALSGNNVISTVIMYKMIRLSRKRALLVVHSYGPVLHVIAI
ncbi:hypothetical protein [Pseudovibrio denitrificans]|uniref:hypothetical protein n=1 Tax=Pseudovibrio denitrificans TaxID=258256 RepID=UPI000ADF7F3E|nr:hypothetical protein [Pseudovibrio denitrificans]